MFGIERLDTFEITTSIDFSSATIVLIHCSTWSGFEISTTLPNTAAELWRARELRVSCVDSTSLFVREQK
jgi:hypothetical protein